jgi:hypothetical protein
MFKKATAGTKESANRMKSNKRRHFIKKRVLIAGCVIAAVAAMVYLLLYLFFIDDNAVVMKVDGYPVTRVEFQFYMNMKKPDVESYFHQKFGVSANGDFWKHKFKGEQPFEMLMNKTKQAVIEDKTLEVSALEHGLTKDISFAGMLKSMAQVNKVRADNFAKGKTEYGVIEFTRLTYYFQMVSDLKTKLESKLEGKEVVVTENQVRSLYDSKYSTYNNNNNIKVAELHIPYLPDGQQANKNVTLSRQDAYNIMADIRDQLSKGQDFNALCLKYTNAKATEVILNDNEAVNSASTEGLLLQYAFKVPAGGYSQPFESGFGFSILKIIGTGVSVNTSYSDAYQGLYNTVLDRNFMAYLAQRAEKANTVIKAAYRFIH